MPPHAEHPTETLRQERIDPVIGCVVWRLAASIDPHDDLRERSYPAPLDVRRRDVANRSAAISPSNPVPSLNVAGTMGKALFPARAVGFGRWELAGSEWRLYAPDGVTPVVTLQVEAPTRRERGWGMDGFVI